MYDKIIAFDKKRSISHPQNRNIKINYSKRVKKQFNWLEVDVNCQFMQKLSMVVVLWL